MNQNCGFCSHLIDKNECEVGYDKDFDMKGFECSNFYPNTELRSKALNLRAEEESKFEEVKKCCPVCGNTDLDWGNGRIETMDGETIEVEVLLCKCRYMKAGIR